jgi:excisionase family DNA binding protein
MVRWHCPPATHLPVLYGSLTIMSADSASAVELLTISEVARLLRVSVSAVRRLQQARRLPFIKIGGSVRFSKTDIISYLRGCRVESQTQ